MKRTLVALLIGVAVITACGADTGKNESNAPESTVSETTVAETPAPESSANAEAATKQASDKTPETTQSVTADKTPEYLAAKIAEDIDDFQDEMEKTMKSYGMNYDRYKYEISTNESDIVVNMYSGSLSNAMAAANGDEFSKQAWESTQKIAEMNAGSYQDLKLQYNLPDTHITLNVFDKEDNTALMISYLDKNCTFDISKQSGFENKASTVQQDTYRKKLEESLDKVIPGLYKVDYTDDKVEIIIDGSGTAKYALAADSDSAAKKKWTDISLLVASVQSLADVLQTNAGSQKKTIVIKLIDPAYSDTPLIEYRDGKLIGPGK